MENNQGIPYQRLCFTRKERLPDRFLLSEVHELEGKGRVWLMAITIEIQNPWHHANQFGVQLAATLVREFSRNNSNSDLVRFEAALKQANQVIAQAQDKLQVPVHCAVTLTSSHEVHFTSTGSAAVLLYRDGKFNEVSEESGAEISLFSAVTSGDLSEGELIASANRSFAGYIKQLSPVIDMEAGGLEAFATEITETAPQDTRDTFTGIFLLHTPAAEHSHYVINWDSLEHVVPLKLKIPHLKLTPLTEFIKTLAYKIGPAVGRLVLSLSKTSTQGIKGIRQRTFNKKTPRLPKVVIPKLGFVALVIFVILGVSGSVIGLRNWREARQEVPTPSYIDTLNSLTQSEQLSQLSTDFNYKAYANLSDSDKSQFNQLLAAHNLSAVAAGALVSELPENAQSIDGGSDILFVIDTSGQLWKLKGGLLSKIDHSPLITDPSSLVTFNEDKAVISDKAGNVWFYDGASPHQLTAISLPSTLASGEKILAKYQANLYLFSQSSKTLFKVENYSKELDSAKVSLKPELFPSELQDLAINGDIISLDKQSQLSIIRAKKNIGQTPIVPPSSTQKVLASERIPKIVITNGRLLQVLNDNGRPEKTELLLDEDMIQDAVISEDGQSLWVAVGSKIYNLPLQN